MHPWLTYALLGLCGLTVVFAIWVADKTEHRRWHRVARSAIPLQLAGLLGAYLVLRPGQGDDAQELVTTVQEAQEPTFVAFHSNYCGACLYARPAVDALANELKGDVNFARLNVDDEAAHRLFRRHNFSAVPAFLLLDSQGREIYRQQGGTPAREQVLAAVEEVHQRQQRGSHRPGAHPSRLGQHNLESRRLDDGR